MRKIFYVSGLFLFLACFVFGQIPPATEWVKKYDIGGGKASLCAMKTDAERNVYLVGGMTPYGTNNIITMKIDSRGNLLWKAVYNGPYSRPEDWPTDMDVDPDGNVYVLGTSRGQNGPYDYVILKYDNNGNLSWFSRYDRSPGGSSEGSAADFDSAGNYYVTGLGQMWPNQDMATLKYSTAGAIEWVAAYNDSPQNPAGVGRRILVDAEGAAVVAGYVWNDGDRNKSQIAVLKYDAAGNQVWVTKYSNPPDHGKLFVYDMRLDPQGDIYIAATSYEHNYFSPESELLLLKYDSSGTLLWESRYAGDLSGSHYPHELALDTNGDIIVIGRISDSTGNNAVLKYDPSGNLVWSIKSLIYSPMSIDMDLDLLGNIYLGGGKSGRGSTAKFDGQGGFKWEVFFESSNGSYKGEKVKIDELFDVYVGGSCQESDSGNDIYLIKYSTSPADRTEEISEAIVFLPDEEFKNPAKTRKKVFSSKLSEIKRKIEDGNYRGAVQQLENDVLGKMDGFYGGNSGNDWIITERGQKSAYPLVMALIEKLKLL
jgi:hypothetical protein